MFRIKENKVDIKEYIEIMKNKYSEFLNFIQVIFMLDNLKIIKEMELVNLDGKINRIIQDNGKMELLMDMDIMYQIKVILNMDYLKIINQKNKCKKNN